MVEERRGSGRAKLSCIGRDIESRELELRCNEDNIWGLVSDSYENPDLLLPDIILLGSDFRKDKTEYSGSPSELASLISRKENKISERKISKPLFPHQELLLQKGIRYAHGAPYGRNEVPSFQQLTGRLNSSSLRRGRNGKRSGLKWEVSMGNRNQILKVRMTEREYDIIMKNCIKLGRTIRELLRECACEKEIIMLDRLHELVTELLRQGNKLNQLTVMAWQERISFVGFERFEEV